MTEPTASEHRRNEERSERGGEPAVAKTLVRSDRVGAVATLTLDSPHNRNALSAGLIGQLTAELASCVADPAVRVIVVTHTGPVFCSGADLKETAAAFGTEVRGIPAAAMGDVLAAVWDSPKPVLARVGGPARAGGLGLVAAADIAVCVDTATFAFSEVRLGVVPAVISATVLPRLTPRAATELFLTGDQFDGAAAERIGLVTKAVPQAELDNTVRRYTESLLRGAPQALAEAKRLVRRSAPGSIQAQLAELTELSVRFFTSDEGREGVRSFAEKRDPAWVTES
jgi:methylglutaconyl-CoA hydratase